MVYENGTIDEASYLFDQRFGLRRVTTKNDVTIENWSTDEWQQPLRVSWFSFGKDFVEQSRNQFDATKNTTKFDELYPFKFSAHNDQPEAHIAMLNNTLSSPPVNVDSGVSEFFYRQVPISVEMH
jgi:hypothetical protein